MKSRKEAKGKTASQILFAGTELITSRPEYMSHNEYRVVRDYQQRVIKKIHRRKPDPKLTQLMGLKQGYNFHPMVFKPKQDAKKE